MNHKHRKTLHSLFSHPLSANISMKDVEHVFGELGATLEHDSGSVSVKLGSQRAKFHDNTHSLGKDEVVRIRNYLEACGIDPVRDYPL